MNPLRSVFMLSVGIAFCSVTVCTGTAFSEDSKAIPIPRTRISMVMPEGFKMNMKLNAYDDEKTGAIILFSDLPATPELVTRSFDAKGFEGQGMKLVTKKRPQKFGALSGYVVEASEQLEKRLDYKFIVAFGEIETTMIAATYPSTFPKARQESLKAAILTAKLRDEYKDADIDRSVPEALKHMIGSPTAPVPEKSQ